MAEQKRSKAKAELEAQVKDLEARLWQTNRAQRLLSRYSRSVVRADEENTLLDSVCRLVVEEGGYRLAWVGLAEQDERRSVRIVAQAGYEDGYLETLDITWADSERGRGPTGTAIRTGKPSIARNIPNDPHFAPWRRQALARGYASSIALPLMVGEQILGALSIYAVEADAFDQVETKLLWNLADDLAFGLSALRNRAERQRAEKELELFLWAVEASREAISISDPQGQTIYVNKAHEALFGWSLEEIKQTSIWDRYPQDTADLLRSDIAAALFQGTGWEGELRALDANGRQFPVWLRADSILDDEGKMMYGIGLMHDITERKRTEEQMARLTEVAAEAKILREVDRMRTELIANVSHEIRTPLGLIEVGCSSLLMEDVEFEPEVQKQFLMGIREETSKLKAIVDDLLHLSRLDSGRLFLNRKAIDIALLAREAVTVMQAQTQLHHLADDFSRGPLVAQADSGQIEQVLRNLVSNAVKYAPEGGTVTVQGWKDRLEITICVRDEGVGIPLDEQERIFGRFYRIENEITQRAGGAGLGLAVCQGIVEAHGGRIWVESKPGEGSSFFFTLPLAAE